ncbi:hypothetical protein B0H14DRAFT_2585469 [Mycena olivaceomarginata]|nr:hypothetical protein B0H14DRAFT_2585469 [Mycena olivaceomarginata]
MSRNTCPTASLKREFGKTRCYKIGRGQVSITENRDELVKEGITLGRSKFFLKNFQSTCEEEEIDISDFILAREGITGESNEGSEKTRFIPSPASGITDSAYSGLSDGEKEEFVVINNVISSITWLLEPERGMYSSGSIRHLVYLNSNKSLVLADIQTSKSHNSASKASVLFDLISHTLTGNSAEAIMARTALRLLLINMNVVKDVLRWDLSPSLNQRRMSRT